MSPLSTEIVATPSDEDAVVHASAVAQGVRFRPIVSLRTGRCWAVESVHEDDTDDAVPASAWTRARDVGLAIRLDPYAQDPDALLRALGETFAGARLAIELVAQPFADTAPLVRAALACRREGFLVMSTELGVGHPHVDRIIALAPDVVRIDARLFEGVARSPARLEACRAVMELARSIGALMIADGVTQVADLVELALLGIDLFAGNLIGAPASDPGEGAALAAGGTQVLRVRLRERAEEEVRRRRAERSVHERVFVAVMSRIAQARVRELDAMASTIVRDVEGLEALYVLDQKGVQLTETWLHPSITPRGGFEPAMRGADLGLKEYFLEVGHGQGAYVSRPYVSMASGRVSVTHSRRLRLCDGTHVVVCCDVPSSDPAVHPR